MKMSSNVARRQFLSTLAKVLGAGASASVLSVSGLNAALAYERASNSVTQETKVFSKQQLQTLASICETIIPKTDTPSAAELDCHGFIDNQLNAVHSLKEQQAAIELVGTIDQTAKDKLGQPFVLLPPEKQQQCLIAIEKGKWSNKATIKAFKQLKYLNAFGYFTSEVGATQVLTYMPVPGGYSGSIPVTEHTKNYGSLAFF